MSYPNGHPLILNETDARVVDWEQQLVDLTNQRRLDNGLDALTRTPMLDGLARAHSNHMVIHYFYGHVNPEGDGPTDRLTTVAHSGYLYENVWMVNENDSPEYILDGFWNSPDHKEAILSSSDLIGVGMFRSRGLSVGNPDLIHVTMEFLRSQ